MMTCQKARPEKMTITTDIKSPKRFDREKSILNHRYIWVWRKFKVMLDHSIVVHVEDLCFGKTKYANM